MSHVMTLLHMMSDGKPRSVVEMATEANITSAQVRDALRMLRKRSAIRALDIPFQLTAPGHQWLQQRLDRASRSSKNPNKGKPRAPMPEAHMTALEVDTDATFIHKIVKAPKRCAVVSEAVKSRHALQAAWASA